MTAKNKRSRWYRMRVLAATDDVEFGYRWFFRVFSLAATILFLYAVWYGLVGNMPRMIATLVASSVVVLLMRFFTPYWRMRRATPAKRIRIAAAWNRVMASDVVEEIKRRGAKP